MDIDIHGLELEEAIDEISYILRGCDMRGIQEVSIIHGYHHGQVLKNYIRSEGFLKEMEREGFILSRERQNNLGITVFRLG